MTLREEETYVINLNSGCELFHNGEFVKAIDCFWKAFSINPTSTKVLFNLGNTLDELHDHRAEYFYLAAIELGDLDAVYNMARWYEYKGRTEDAVIYYRQYMKRAPRDSYWGHAASIVNESRTPLEIVWRNQG